MTGAAPQPYSTYDPFAWLYERYFSRRVPMRLFGAAERLVLPHLAPGARVLDLCCGTGRICAALAEHGLRATGVDGSAEMLRLAREAAPTAELVHADARDFRLPHPVDAALSFYDSLNHVETADGLAAVFACVRRALADGGWFLFDLNTEASFERNWRGDMFTAVEPDHCSVVRGSYDPARRLGVCDVTLFRLIGGEWRRADLTITERCHPEDEVRALLAAAGFTVETFDAGRDLGIKNEEGRTFYLARAR